MKYKLVINFLIIALSMFSCNINTPKAKSTLKVIAIDPSKNTFVNFSNIVEEEYRLLGLQLGKDALIGEISNIFIKDSVIFIFDADPMKSVFIFKQDGQFLSKISDFGEDPQKYREIGDFFIDQVNKTINISQTYHAKILIYNYFGDFIREQEISEYARTLTRNANGNYCIFTANVPISDKTNFNLIVKDKNFKTISEYFPLNPVNSTQKMFLTNNFSHFLDSTSFIKPYCDTVFDISNKTLTEKYYFDFGVHSVPEGFYDNYKNVPLPKINKILFKNKYAFCINPFYESKDHIYLKYLFDNHWNSFFVYSKKSGYSFNSSRIVNDINYMPLNLYNSFMLPEANSIITIVYPTQILNAIDGLKEKEDFDFIKNFKMKNGDVFQIAKKITRS